MSSDNVVLSLGPSTLLYQVQAGVQTLLAQGLLVLSNDDGGAVHAKVGEVTWALSKAMPCLRSDDYTYTFAVPAEGGPPIFYCVILEKNLASSDLDLLQSVLMSATQYGGDPAPEPAASRGYGQEAGAGYGADHADGMPQSAIPQIQESVKKGFGMLSSGLSWMAQAAGAGLSAAKERAESTLTPETRAKIDSAKEATMTKLSSFNAQAAKVAAEVRAAASKAASTVTESEFARSESVRTASRATSEVLSAVYRDMQKAGATVSAAVVDMATKVRGGQAGEGPSGHSNGSHPASNDPFSSYTPAGAAAPPAAGGSFPAAASGFPYEPAMGIPVSAPAGHHQGGYYPAYAST